MAGYGLPAEYHLSTVLENDLTSEGYNFEVINGSVSGSTSANGLNRAEWSLSDSVSYTHLTLPTILLV